MAKARIHSYWTEVVAIIEGGLKPDPSQVSAFAMHLASRLEKDGEPRLAERILKLADRAPRPSGSTYMPQRVATDVETQLSLIEEKIANGAPEYPVLSSVLEAEIHRFVLLNRRAVDVQRLGVQPPTTLLMYGPPGCGKTMAGHAIAADLGLPLLVVRLDTLLASYLGNSAKNLRRAFDEAQARPSVLFLDEFDAVGKIRDDPQEVGEIKRLVNSLIQNLDAARGHHIVLAATNHEHLLDTAIWRRFDVTLSFNTPGFEEARAILKRLIGESSLSSGGVDVLSRLAEGLSGSEITDSVTRALQDSILKPDPSSRLLAVELARRRLGHSSASTAIASMKGLIRKIYDLDGRQLPIQHVAHVVACSRAYVHQVLKEYEEADYASRASRSRIP